MQFLIDITALTFSSHYITAVVNIHKVLSFISQKPSQSLTLWSFRFSTSVNRSSHRGYAVKQNNRAKT